MVIFGGVIGLIVIFAVIFSEKNFAANVISSLILGLLFSLLIQLWISDAAPVVTRHDVSGYEFINNSEVLFDISTEKVVIGQENIDVHEGETVVYHKTYPATWWRVGFMSNEKWEAKVSLNKG